MNRTTTLLLPLFLLATALNAQVTITDNEMPHTGDDLTRTRAYTNPFINYAATGAAHTWNFSNLQANTQATAEYQTVASTNFVYALVYADIFFNPNRANHAISGVDIAFNELLPIDNPFTFFYRSASVYKKVGYGAELAGIPVPIIFSEHDVIYELPLDYGDMSNSSSSWEISVPTLAHYGYMQDRDNEVDGWGAITTPAGSFDVLRVKTTLAGRDTIALDSLGIGFTIDRPLVREYKWLAEDLRVPVLQVNTIDLFGLEVVTDIWFYDEPRSIIVVPPIAALCPGSPVDVHYEATGAFNEGGFLIPANDFIAQLSDANGDFTNAVAIGSVEATGNGTIACAIPPGTPFGTGYRIRVISNSPAFIGEDNGYDLVIGGTPMADATAAGPTEFCSGGSVMLDATGGGPYQWQLDGVDIPGATAADLEALASGDYTVTITNGCGTSTSAVITVTVNDLPEHSIDPLSAVSCDGTPIVISSTDLSGQSGLTYQWYLNGSFIGGATASDITAFDSGDYTLEITNPLTGCSYLSGPSGIAIEFVAAPTIAASGSTTFCEGGVVTLDIDPIGGASYQWYMDGAMISGANDTLLLVSDAGAYSVIITSGGGCVSDPSDQVIVVVDPAPDQPTITALGPTTFCEGDAVVLDADLIAGVTYQWSQDGIELAGATDPQLTVTESGTYTVVVTGSNGCGSEAIASMDVVVNPLPAIPVITASSDTLMASGTGSFQWYLYGDPIVGATDAELVTFTTGNYTVTVTDANGCTTISDVYTYISTGVAGPAGTDLIVFPNPSSAAITISMNAPGDLFEIIDGAGKLVMRGRMTGSKTTLDLASHPAGLYLLRILGDSEVAPVRIVLE